MPKTFILTGKVKILVRHNIRVAMGQNPFVQSRQANSQIRCHLLACQPARQSVSVP